MKLLIATDNFLPRWDGISRFLSEVVPRLKGFEVTILAPNFGKVPKKFKVKKVPLSNKSFGDFRIAKLKSDIIKREVEKNDLIFVQTLGPIGFYSIRHARNLNKKVVSFVHSLEWELVPKASKIPWVKKLIQPLAKTYSTWLHNKSDLLIVPAQSIAEKISWLGLKSKKVVVNLGVDSEKFKPLKQREDVSRIEKIRKSLKLENSYVIGYHGRLAREKDIFTLLRAFKWMNRNHKDIKLLVVGDGLKEIKNKLEATPNVVWVPAKDDVQNYLNLMDCYVTPSTTETTSLTTLEALSSGLPVLSTPVGFISDYIKDGYNGIIFPIGKAYTLYKFLELVKQSPGLARDLGRRGRRTIIEKFSWEKASININKALKEA